jgi:hypothetical protein
LSPHATEGLAYLIKDSRTSTERESATPFDGWRLYVHNDARSTFDTSLPTI